MGVVLLRNTMRTTVLATLLSFSLVACAGQISGGGDDDDVPENCGNGVMDTGETCDDSNLESGDGCSSACAVEAVPRVALTVQNALLTTDLEVENIITVTATSEMGFSGGVVLSASVVDGTNTPISGWTATFETTVIDLTSVPSGTAQLKLVVPGNHESLAGTIKISGSSAVAPSETSIDVTANPVVAVTFTAVGGACVYPARGVNNPVRIKAGRQMMVYNGAAAGTMTIHAGGVTGFGHQDTATALLAGQAYSGTTTTAGQQADFYCHAGGAGTLGEGDPNLHPFLRTDP